MTIYLLERLRKFFKSLGKKELKIHDFIILKKFKEREKNFSLNFENFKPEIQVSEKVKIVAAISFFFDKNKIHNLKKVCNSLIEISKDVEINIFTNHISEDQKKALTENFKENVEIIVIDNIVHNRLLPWYHLNLMKSLFKREDITHFIYLEDDILIDKNNFNYWVNSRKILKKYNLIPGFVRTEVNELNNQLYAIDFVKKNYYQNLPKITVNNYYSFVNHNYPYQGMYLYDRELMNEHLSGPSSNPDCGHGAYDTNYINPKMINLDLMAKANIGLTYLNVPEGFFNRMVTLYNKSEKEIDKNCQIKHLSNKYSNTKSWFGNIKVKDSIC